MRRRVFRFALAAIGVFALVAGAIAAWMHTDDARQRFEALASEALNRDVRVSAVDVGWTALTLHELTVSDPWSEGPAIAVERGEFEVEWSALFRGGLEGSLRAEGFELDVRKRGNTTNLHGIRRHRSGKKRPLNLRLVLEGGAVRIHDEDRGETVSLQGVSLQGRIQRAQTQRVVSVDARARRIVAVGLAVHDVGLALELSREHVELSALEARLEAGRLTGRGRVDFDTRGSWSAELEARDIGLSGELLPIVVAVFPAAAGIQSAPEGDTAGSVSLRAEVRGTGFTRHSVLQSLHGALSVRLAGVALPIETAVVRVAALLGRPAEPLSLPVLDVEASVHRGWVTVDDISSDGRPVVLPFDGRVSLEGELDLEVDVLPLLRAGAQTHAWARRYTAAVPIRLEGTVSQPQVRPPSVSSVAKALGVAWVDRALP